MKRLLPFVLVIGAGACDRSPTNHEDIHTLEMTAPHDTLQLGASMEIDLQVHGVADPIPLITWSSSNPDVLDVTNGRVTALRAGYAFVRASTTQAADSFGITVHTSACSPRELVPATNQFWGTHILPGSTLYAGHEGATLYKGVPIFYGSGLVYGTHPDTMVLGYDYWIARSELGGGICSTGSAPMETTALLEMAPRPSGAPVNPNGITVAQDQWAFGDADGEDYVIFRFTFTNTGGTSIENLRVGFAADFDVYQPEANVGKFDPVSKVASVVSSDSTNKPVVAGLTLLGADVGGYYTAPAWGTRLSREGHFNALRAAVVGTSSTAVQDVRQIVGIAPFVLAPGASVAVGYALIAGDNRADFERNVAAARIRAAKLW